MPAYYNEFDKKTAAWLRQLISDGLIAPGDVDERSIKDVQPDDLKGYEQCHFFAGIGGWSYALRLSGIPDNAPVWTGSCPCQPFSAIGERKGIQDERHLWPEFNRLIAARLPVIVFGEQVEDAIGHGWLDGVFADLETENYTCGAAVLGAHSKRAPHKRQRLWWMAYRQAFHKFWRAQPGERARKVCSTGTVDRPQIGRSSGVVQLEYADLPNENEWSSVGEQSVYCQCDNCDPWSRHEIIRCADAVRRIEPGVLPLADGIPYRLEHIRGYGNAIVPQVAAEFIQASIEAIEETLTDLRTC